MRSVITGGPGCGKSTLLDALSHAGMSTMPEVARDILRRPDGMDMRANDPPSSMLRAAPKKRLGRCSAFASTPPVSTLPELGTTVL